MTSSRVTSILAALALAAVLTGCKERKDPCLLYTSDAADE